MCLLLLIILYKLKSSWPKLPIGSLYVAKYLDSGTPMLLSSALETAHLTYST